jgi:hypothetical protein
MCVFFCANAKVTEWVAATLDISCRQGLQLCVWEATEHAATAKLPDVPRADSQRRPSKVGRPRADRAKEQHAIRSGYPSRVSLVARLSKQPKSPNPFTDAWGCLWRWIWGGR